MAYNQKKYIGRLWFFWRLRKPTHLIQNKKKAQKRIKDQFFQHWTSEINISSKFLKYRMPTTTLNLKTYSVNLSYHERCIMAKFLCREHNLPIESCCRQGIPRNLRICELWTLVTNFTIFLFVLTLKTYGRN